MEGIETGKVTRNIPQQGGWEEWNGEEVGFCRPIFWGSSPYGWSCSNCTNQINPTVTF